MSSQLKKNAAIVAVMVALIYTSGMLYLSEGITYYWIDESPGPTYVRYARTPTAILGFNIFLVTVGGLIVFVVYKGIDD